MTIEAIYISNLKPGLNTRYEYRGRERTLNVSSYHNFDLGKKNRAKTLCMPKQNLQNLLPDGQYRKIRNRDVFKEIDNSCKYELQISQILHK